MDLGQQETTPIESLRLRSPVITHQAVHSITRGENPVSAAVKMVLKKLTIPKNWPPSGVGFVTEAPVHSKVSQQHWRNSSSQLRSYAESQGLPLLHVPRCLGPCPNVHIVTITDPRHPACNQRGLVAAKNIPASTHIIDYVGQIATDDTVSDTSDYVLRLGPDVSIDAEVIGNEARFVNDFRGIRKKPNCKFELYRDKGSSGQVRMGVFSLCDIKKGEELCISYGKGFWKARGLAASWDNYTAYEDIEISGQ